MDSFAILLLAIGLSMDSFAVAIADGMVMKDLKHKQMLLISFSLAIFQGGLPILGWIAGKTIDVYVKEIDHWIAFVLLSFIGGKMLYESFQNKSEVQKEKRFSYSLIITQSIATSIDAFAVGISFAFIYSSLVLPSIVISLVTFSFAYIGIRLGSKCEKYLGNFVEKLGGIILILLGTKILIEHLYFQ
ncbi:manganese efflux pump [Marinilabiliaceae bacterium JC040]|nr:manganese efflux pump [Marinilabiliaceae bacterium JC040]